jgi:hypothetical protein
LEIEMEGADARLGLRPTDACCIVASAGGLVVKEEREKGGEGKKAGERGSWRLVGWW